MNILNYEVSTNLYPVTQRGAIAFKARHGILGELTKTSNFKELLDFLGYIFNQTEGILFSTLPSQTYCALLHLAYYQELEHVPKALPACNPPLDV